MRHNRSMRRLGVQKWGRPSVDLIWDKQVTSAVTLIGEESWREIKWAGDGADDSSK